MPGRKKEIPQRIAIAVLYDTALFIAQEEAS